MIDLTACHTDGLSLQSADMHVKEHSHFLLHNVTGEESWCEHGRPLEKKKNNE